MTRKLLTALAAWLLQCRCASASRPPRLTVLAAASTVAVLVAAVLVAVVLVVAVLDSIVVFVVASVAMISAVMAFTAGMADSIQGTTGTAGTGMGAATTLMPATATTDLPRARRGRSPPVPVEAPSTVTGLRLRSPLAYGGGSLPRFVSEFSR
jgi:hypothetical protein